MTKISSILWGLKHRVIRYEISLIVRSHYKFLSLMLSTVFPINCENLSVQTLSRFCTFRTSTRRLDSGRLRIYPTRQTTCWVMTATWRSGSWLWPVSASASWASDGRPCSFCRELATCRWDCPRTRTLQALLRGQTSVRCLRVCTFVCELAFCLWKWRRTSGLTNCRCTQWGSWSRAESRSRWSSWTDSWAVWFGRLRSCWQESCTGRPSWIAADSDMTSESLELVAVLLLRLWLASDTSQSCSELFLCTHLIYRVYLWARCFVRSGSWPVLRV